ncbi:MAG: hypothetical protein MJE77_37995 [Proteobacteria bacterium]|nr:hypothetical protein [Pseudomonadota bacterium]
MQTNSRAELLRYPQSGRRCSGPGVLVLLLVASCSDLPEPLLAITGIEPAEVSSRIATPAVVTGRGFFATVRVSLDGDQPTAVDVGFSIRIGDTEVSPNDVSVRDSQTIEMTIAPGLPPGEHTVVMISPRGQRASISQGLTVLDDAELVLFVEDMPGGAGVPVERRTLQVDDTLHLYAVGRRQTDGSFLSAVNVQWQCSGPACSLDRQGGSEAIFTATRPGVARVTAQHPIYELYQTGNLTVQGPP